MSEFLDKQINAQKEFEKYFQGSRKLLQAHEKVCDEMKVESRKKTTGAYNIYKAHAENSCPSDQKFLIY